MKLQEGELPPCSGYADMSSIPSLLKQLQQLAWSATTPEELEAANKTWAEQVERFKLFTLHLQKSSKQLEGFRVARLKKCEQDQNRALQQERVQQRAQQRAKEKEQKRSQRKVDGGVFDMPASSTHPMPTRVVPGEPVGGKNPQEPQSWEIPMLIEIPWLGASPCCR